MNDSRLASSRRGVSAVCEQLEPRMLLAAADLVVENVFFTPGDYRPSEPIELNWDITNYGGAAAGTFSWDVLLSTDRVADDNDYVVGSTSIDGLAAGEVWNPEEDLYIPYDMADGQYYLIIRADIDSEVVEPNELNNTWVSASAAISVSSADDGYEINDVRAYAFELMDYEGQWLSTIYGTGIQANEDWYSFYVDNDHRAVTIDCTYDTSKGGLYVFLYNKNDQFLMDSWEVTGGQQLEYIVQQAGNYYICVTSDDNAGLVYDMRWQSQPTPAPELSLKDVTYTPGTNYPGECQYISWKEVESSGSSIQPGHPYKVEARYSTDKIWGNSDDVVFYSVINTDGLQGTVSKEKYALPPSSTPNGSYYVGMMIDADNAYSEGNESDNLWWSTNADVIIDGSEDAYEPNSLSWATAFDLTSYRGKWLSEINGEGILNDIDGYILHLDPRKIKIEARYQVQHTGFFTWSHSEYNPVVTSSVDTADGGVIEMQTDGTPVCIYLSNMAQKGVHYDLRWDWIPESDLTIQNFSATGLYINKEPGTSFTANWDAVNRGDLDVAAPVNVVVHISNDQTWGDADDITLYSQALDGLKGYETLSMSAEMTIPASLRRGTYYLGFAIDPSNTVTEFLESNNIYWKSCTLDHDPTLSHFETLTGATEDTKFTITYDMLKAAGDEADLDGDPVKFEVLAPWVGTWEADNTWFRQYLQIGPYPMSRYLVWTPPPDANGVIAAITFRAFGGRDQIATLYVNVAPVNDAPSAIDQTVFACGGSTEIELAGADKETLAGDLLSSIVQPPAHGTLTNVGGNRWGYLAEDGYRGTDSFTFTMTDTGDPAGSATGAAVSAPAVVTIDVTGSNQPPTFIKGDDQIVDEDCATVVLPGWATGISAGEPGQSVAFFVTTDAPGLFAQQPAISPDGTLSFRPAQNANGVATVTAYLKDNGGTGSGGQDTSAEETFSITIRSINDGPSLVVPEPQVIDANTPLVFSSVDGNSIQVQDPDANGFPVRFSCSATNGVISLAGVSGLVMLSGTGSGDSQVVAEGTIDAINAALDGLTFTPNEDYDGPAGISVSVDDLGNSGQGGAKQAQQTVAVSVVGANAAPSFNPGGDVTIDEDAGPQVIAGWATDISPGSASEIGQELEFLVGNDNPDIFVVEPSLSVNGELSFTCADNVSGIANVTVVLRDNGGTAGGGYDSSEPVTFAINVSSVNDVPTARAPAPLTGALQDSDFQIDYETLLGATGAEDVEDDPISFVVTELDNGELTIDGHVVAVGDALQAGQKLLWHPQAAATGTVNAFKLAVFDGQDQTGPFAVQVIVTPLLCVEAGGAASGSVNFVDGDGSKIKVTISNGSMKMYFTGDDLGSALLKKITNITGQNLKLQRIELIASSMLTQIKVTASGGTVEGTAISEIVGTSPLGVLSAKPVVIEKGLAFTGGGYVGSLDLKELLAGGDIRMEGSAGPKGIKITAGDFGASTQLVTGSRIASLKIGQWSEGRLEATSLGSLTVAGDKKRKLPGNLGIDLKMTGVSGVGVNSIDKVTVAGDLVGGRWNVPGVIGKISVSKGISEWVLGDEQEPVGVSQLQAKGAIGSSNLSASLFGTIKALSWMGGMIRTGSIGSLSLTGNLMLQSVYADDVKQISVGGDCSGEFDLNSLQKSTIKGSLSNASLQCRSNVGLSLANLKVTGWVRDTQIMARGDIGTVTAGGMKDSDVFAGVIDLDEGPVVSADSYQLSAEHAIKSITITGKCKWEELSTIGCRWGASQIGNLAFAYPDMAETIAGEVLKGTYTDQQNKRHNLLLELDQFELATIV